MKPVIVSFPRAGRTWTPESEAKVMALCDKYPKFYGRYA